MASITDAGIEAEAPSSGRIGQLVANLPPASFSLVMATGAVSTSAQLRGWDQLSWALLGLNVIVYLVLVALLAIRCARHFDRVRDDFRSHARAPGLLTTVAGTAILGTEFMVRTSRPGVALVLWILAIVLWIGLVYGFFGLMTVLPSKPSLDDGINASWMLLVVATQSVSILGTLLTPDLGRAAAPALAFATTMFLLGCMFYMLLFTLILYRYLFFPLDPAGMSPPYWINMGAVAITTLAGSLLILQGGASPLVRELVPFLRGFTLLFWATATWWFPLVLALGAWRHILRRVPIRYDAQYWSMVFPLGMYTIATARIGDALAWQYLATIAGWVGLVAIVAWALAFAGLLRRIISRPTRPRPSVGMGH